MNRVIHQIWGLCPQDENSEPPARLIKCSLTWQNVPGWTYKRWNRKEIEELIESCPKEWKDTFYRLSHWVEQCDFARYIIVYLFGGLYTDMDTILKSMPIEPRKGFLVVGLEANVSEPDKIFNGLARTTQLCQWTFSAWPKSLALLSVIHNIVNSSTQMCITDKTTSNIMNTTGPGIFTDSIINREDILILPIYAFGCGQSHSNSPDKENSSCNVIHTFEGSWKVPRNFVSVVRVFKNLWNLL